METKGHANVYGMYTFVYIYICIFVCVRVCVYMCVYRYRCICVCIDIDIGRYAEACCGDGWTCQCQWCVHVCICVGMHVCGVCRKGPC